MQRILGIDPGVTGALALLIGGSVEEIIDMPTIEVRGKLRVWSDGVTDAVVKLNPDLVAIEEVGVMPKQGIASGFSFGHGAGILEGVCSALSRPRFYVRPNVWKREAGVPADKGAARQMASRRWPDHSPLFARVKDDGRAEAALLAYWLYVRDRKAGS